jgi:hypothetical protein
MADEAESPKRRNARDNGDCNPGREVPVMPGS